MDEERRARIMNARKAYQLLKNVFKTVIHKKTGVRELCEAGFNLRSTDLDYDNSIFQENGKRNRNKNGEKTNTVWHDKKAKRRK